jgi:indolepyruvate ferredoxin oxidoreductase, beta subunit
MRLLLSGLLETCHRGGGLSYNILLVGVGGQGVLLASTVMGNAAMDGGLEVVMSELHGMAQRGGSVTASVRIGKDVKSPLIQKGGADVLLGFEPVETYRYLPFANKSTNIVVNVRPIIPIQVSMGAERYPEVDEILYAIRQVNDHLLTIDADDLALRGGNRMTASSVLIGAVCALDGFPIPRETLVHALLERVPAKYTEVNAKAFELGYDKTKADILKSQS